MTTFEWPHFFTFHCFHISSPNNNATISINWKSEDNFALRKFFLPSIVFPLTIKECGVWWECLKKNTYSFENCVTIRLAYENLEISSRLAYIMDHTLAWNIKLVASDVAGEKWLQIKRTTTLLLKIDARELFKCISLFFKFPLDELPLRFTARDKYATAR